LTLEARNFIEGIAVEDWRRKFGCGYGWIGVTRILTKALNYVAKRHSKKA
jgi:hypothetical protein